MTLVERAVKRGLDIVGALAAIVLLVPIFIFAALAIRRDSRGPVIFRQRRSGLNQREFTIFKFRTMYVQEDGMKVVQAQREDPRVTRIGRFLRRTSIDELPQLFNVLKGEMSLVGPRPHAMAHDSEYNERIAVYSRRFTVKPGITGWAQVHGFRGETKRLFDMRQRIDYDLWYIDNWSLALDMKILARTCFEILKQDAY